MQVLPYARDKERQWDDFCGLAVNATFLHSRRFLNYHGDRFKDASLFIEDKGDLVGLLPAAADPSDATTVVSHPGITYGGVLHQGKVRGALMMEAFDTCLEHFRKQGFQRLRYKAIPYIYSKVPNQDDLYALFRCGAERYRCDLSCTIDLANRLTSSERRRRGLKKARSKAIYATSAERLPEFWSVVEDNLRRKHDAAPVHCLSEIQDLVQRFPDNIRLHLALIDDKVEAGIVVFQMNGVHHAQYIAASLLAYETSALDLVFEHAIQSALSSEARYFDFGTSNEDGGRILNAGLYQFKAEFGGAGVVHEYYQLGL